MLLALKFGLFVRNETKITLTCRKELKDIVYAENLIMNISFNFYDLNMGSSHFISLTNMLSSKENAKFLDVDT